MPEIVNRTTQQGFHPMLGHVADGTEILMDNGDVVILKAVMKGWQLFHNDRPLDVPTDSAHVVACLVFSYPGSIDGEE